MKLTDEQINLFLARRPLTPEAQKADAEAADIRRRRAEAWQRGDAAFRIENEAAEAQEEAAHPEPRHD